MTSQLLQKANFSRSFQIGRAMRFRVPNTYFRGITIPMTHFSGTAVPATPNTAKTMGDTKQRTEHKKAEKTVTVPIAEENNKQYEESKSNNSSSFKRNLLKYLCFGTFSTIVAVATNQLTLSYVDGVFESIDRSNKLMLQEKLKHLIFLGRFEFYEIVFKYTLTYGTDEMQKVFYEPYFVKYTGNTKTHKMMNDKPKYIKWFEEGLKQISKIELPSFSSKTGEADSIAPVRTTNAVVLKAPEKTK